MEGKEGQVRLAVCGAGFWSRFQINGWRELPGAQVVAIYNRSRGKAEALARELGIPQVYDDAEAMLRECRPDALDIITDVDSHPRFVELAAAHKTAVICQKPMAPTIAQAAQMVDRCRQAGVPFYVHENFRHQHPIRQLKAVLDSGEIGEVHRARIDFISGFAVFTNQPFLAELKQFILTDVGSHIFDVARYLFGDARSIYCRTQRVHAHIAGEDVATALLDMGGASVSCNMAYAGNPLEQECFPQTLVFVEGSRGSVQLGRDYDLRVTTSKGTRATRVPPKHYSWADSAYDLVHSSIVDCSADLLAGLRGQRTPQTTGEDNLRTMRLVYGAYASARRQAPVAPESDEWFDDSLPQG